MDDTLEIMFDDLIPTAQQKVLDFYALETPQDGNYDTMPITVLGKDD